MRGKKHEFRVTNVLECQLHNKRPVSIIRTKLLMLLREVSGIDWAVIASVRFYQNKGRPFL